MTRRPYERPIIVRHESGLGNKLSRVPALRPQEEIDGVSVEELVKTYGSPLFVFSEQTLVQRQRALADAFAVRWPKVRTAWSYKTNYLDGICRVLHREGAWAEVVSEMELDKALHNGVRPDHIHFNGPFKPESALEKAFRGGTLVHLDNFDELRRAEQVATRLGKRPGVAIRLSVAAEGIPPWTRFGFHLESGQARDAVRRLLAGDKLDLVGLHCHLGTFLLDPAAYREAAGKLAAFAEELRTEHGIRLQFIDIGGGFASHNALKAQYLPAEQATPSFEQYADAVCDGLRALQGPPKELPTLVLETGRAIVDDAGYLITTVHATRRLPDGRRGVVLDAGVNVLFTAWWYRHDVVPTRHLAGIPEPTVLYGPLCMNIDVVRDALPLPPVEAGDRLVLRNVGAYNVTQWMQFITLRPAVVMVGRNGQHGLLRKPETLEALTSWEEVPEWI
ncbi:MAG: alanine racemase [Alphaproteobacteria bacterium]|nr:alanine racemase [Alphaproteobacteria bacterium]